MCSNNACLHHHASMHYCQKNMMHASLHILHACMYHPKWYISPILGNSLSFSNLGTVILQNKRKTNFFSKASGLKFCWKIFSSEISKFDEKIFPKNIFQKFLKCWPYIENCQIFILGKKHVICILRRFSKIKNHKFGSISSNSDADKLKSAKK